MLEPPRRPVRIRAHHRGIFGKVADQNPDLSQRQPRLIVFVDPPPVPIVAEVIAREVGLHRVRMIAEQPEEAPYSPAFLKPSATATSSISGSKSSAVAS